MTDTSVMQERIGQLCHQFKLPTMGTQSVARFTAAGHGEALPTFLEVLEQEADDRRQRRIDRLRKMSRLPSGKTWENLRARPDAPVPAAATGSAGQRRLHRTRRQRAGLRIAWHRQDPRPVRGGPPPGGGRPLRPLRSSLPLGAGTPRRQTRTGFAPATAQTGQLRLPALGRSWLPAPGC